MLKIILLFCVSLKLWAAPTLEDKLKDDPLYLNKKVAEFVQNSIGKKIFEGESVDLPLEALKSAGAKWKFPTETIFGKEVNTRYSDIEPGDILQFDNAEFENKKTKQGWNFSNNSLMAVSYNKKTKLLKFATQNFMGNPNVAVYDLELETLKRGSYKIFRPEPPSAEAQPQDNKGKEEKK